MTSHVEYDRKVNILLVDDQPESLLALEAILQDLGQNLVQARSGREALRHVLAEDFAVILLDVQMPDMDGFETAALIRQRDRSATTPIIFLTAAYQNEDQVFRGYTVGAVDYIIKPPVPAILKSKVSVFVDLMKTAELVRRQVEELRRAEEKFRAVTETANDAIVSADTSGKITYFNPAAERLFGYAATEALGQPLSLLMPERFHEAHNAGMAHYLATGESHILGKTVELSGRRKDGGEFPIELSLAARDAGGKTFFTAILRDISERKRAEEEREQMGAELLKGQKLQAIGQLAAGIAHEINNPTAYVLSNLTTIGDALTTLDRVLRSTRDLVRRLGSGESPESVGRDLESLARETEADFLLADFQAALRDSKRGAERIRDIVKGLREFSHPDEKTLKGLDLNDSLENTIRLCWNELKFKTTVHRDYGKLPMILGYPQRLEQVFVNLLVNAAQAIVGKGDIHVSTRVEEERVVIRIRDTGTGIAPENLGKLFEPFFTTKSVGKGTGLGLHVAYKIVTAHGGKIEVRSELERGTEFTIRLPLGGPGGEAAAPAPAAEIDGVPVVVCVDDDPATLRLLKRLLGKEPYELLTTRRAEQALEWVRDRNVRVVVSDQRMNGMEGTRLLEEVRIRRPAARRILLTAYPEGAEGLEPGPVHAVLRKPWDDQMLKQTIRDHLRPDPQPVRPEK